MTASEQAAAKGGPITQVPVALGGEGVGGVQPQPSGGRQAAPDRPGPRRRSSSGRSPAGTTRPWPPSTPSVTLPPAAITVAHRSDGSGTTYIFSNYLSSVSPAWASKVGVGKALNWPAGEGAEGNGGVATTVFRTTFSIGYVEQAYSKGLVLPFAAIRNQAGTSSSHQPRPSRPTPPRSPASRRPTSLSSTSPAPAVTRSAATAGHWCTPVSPARAAARRWLPCWTG